jgi:hypothetical protein
MSLLQRVTSVETLSPERGRSPAGSRSPRDRKLSFSPLPGSWVPPEVEQNTEAIGAFEVPKSKRICEFSSPNYWCFLS